MNLPTVFLSYSHQDTVWKDRLLSHLRVLERQKKIEIWDTNDIQTVADWSQQIFNAVKKADVAVLLISPDFLASDFIVGRELPALLKRREKEGLAILPVVVRPAPWSQIQELAQLQFLNTDAKPLAADSEYEVDQSLANIAKIIGDITGAISERESVRPPKGKGTLTQRGPRPRRKDWMVGISFPTAKLMESLQSYCSLGLIKKGLALG